MPRTMYDSVTARDIPLNAQMVAGYVDGAYTWTISDWARFRGKPHVRITVGSGTLDAEVADCENGDYTPTTAAAWLKRKVARDGYGYIYFSLSKWPELHAAVVAAGVKDTQWGTWVADWDGKAVLASGWAMKQYANPTLSHGHYDLSIVADHLPLIDSEPAPATTPTPGPAPQPAPPPPAPASVDQVRAAFGRFADSLISSFQSAIAEIEQAKSDLANL